MKLYLDTSSWQLSTAPGATNTTVIVPAKNATELLLEIFPSTPLAPGTLGTLVAKPKDKYTAVSVSWDPAWESPANSQSGYIFRLPLNTAPLASLFAPSVKSLQLMAEITIVFGESVRKTQTFTIAVAREVSTGELGTPVELPSLKATDLQAVDASNTTNWTTPRAVSLMVATLVGAYQTAAQVASSITSYGYQTATQVASSITSYGYQTAAQVASAITSYGYQTAAQVASSITSYGYQTAAQVSASISSAISALGLGTASTKAISDFAPASGIPPTAISGTAVVTNDPRLSDARNPTAHTHAIADTNGLQAALDGKQPAGNYQPSGNYAPLVGGMVPASLLPSYVDDVLEFSSLAEFPVTGETGKIYVATASGLIYRWSGSSYIEISPSPGSTDAVPEGATNLYFTAARALDAVTWATLTGKPTFATVATSGSYDDLLNRPSLISFQPNPETLADSVSDVLYNIPSVGTQRFSRINASLYAYANYFIEKRGAVWVAGFTTENSEGDLIESIIVTSLSDGTYPWQATWPAGTVVTKAPAVRLIGQSDTANGSEGTSAWAARADHTHPLPPNLPDQPVNSGSSPYFQGLSIGDILYFNAGGGEGYGSLGATLELPQCYVFSTDPYKRRDAIIRDEQRLYLGSSDGNSFREILIACAGGSAAPSDGICLVLSGSGKFNTSALTASYTVVGSSTTALLDLAGTWNTSGIVSGIFLNITDNASAATSALMDLGTNSRTQYALSKSRQFWLYNDSPVTQNASNYERGFFRWNSNVLEIGVEALGTGTQRQLSFPLGTVTASTPLAITQTWNNALTTFSAWRVNVTDTASAGSSLLADLQTGGSSRFSVNKKGDIAFSTGTTFGGLLAVDASGPIRLGPSLGGNGVWLKDSANAVLAAFGVNNTYVVRGDFSIGQVGWNGGTVDLTLARDAANTLGLRNGLNAQAYNVYGTYTSSTVFERLKIAATATRNRIISESTGGTVRPLEISVHSSASDPTSSDISAGAFGVWKRTTTGAVKLWINDGGTMKSVTLDANRGGGDYASIGMAAGFALALG